MIPSGYGIFAMRPEELRTLDDWAAAEGWNPGKSDLAIAHRRDPGAFVALRQGQEMIGGGSIFRHGAAVGFMGLFIVRPDRRGRGLGAALWRWRRHAMLRRLTPGATIGMDGVLDMVPFYERGGFAQTYRNVRYEGLARTHDACGCNRLSVVDHQDVFGMDRACFGIPRKPFLMAWLGAKSGIALTLREGGRLTGFGFARPCRDGFKIGPLFAETPAAAERLLRDLSTSVAGARVQLDIPEVNEAAVKLAVDLGLVPTFSCARLYHGPIPDLPVAKIYAVTSLEFG